MALGRFDVYELRRLASSHGWSFVSDLHQTKNDLSAIRQKEIRADRRGDKGFGARASSGQLQGGKQQFDRDSGIDGRRPQRRREGFEGFRAGVAPGARPRLSSENNQGRRRRTGKTLKGDTRGRREADGTGLRAPGVPGGG